MKTSHLVALIVPLILVAGCDRDRDRNRTEHRTGSTPPPKAAGIDPMRNTAMPETTAPIPASSLMPSPAPPVEPVPPETNQVPAGTAPTSQHPTNSQSTVGQTSAGGGFAGSREGHSLTPLEQGNSEIDMATSQAVRRAIADDPGLSTNAKNAIVIANDGVVVVRGAVASIAEQVRIVALAQGVRGVSRVDNQLSIAGP
jgi:hypothetical protein